jgi:hypothetical protein
VDDVSGAAQPILPALSGGHGIERGDIEPDSGGGQIDANHVEEATALLRCLKLVTTVNNPFEYFGGGLRSAPVPKNRTAGYQCSERHGNEQGA